MVYTTLPTTFFNTFQGYCVKQSCPTVVVLSCVTFFYLQHLFIGSYDEAPYIPQSDMSTLFHSINNRHNFVAHTIISCSVSCSTQFQAIEKLLEVGRKKHDWQPTAKLIPLVDVGYDFLPCNSCSPSPFLRGWNCIDTWHRNFSGSLQSRQGRQRRTNLVSFSP